MYRDHAKKKEDAMTETKMTLKRKRVSLLVLAALVAATLAGRAVMRSDGIVDGGPGHFTAPNGKSVFFSGRLSQNAVLLGGDGRAQMELILKAEEREGLHVSPVPTDLVVILDRSGSMQGEKMEYARAAVGELIGQLNPHDRFALVSYSSGAHLSIPLTPAALQAREIWRREVARIQPNGGTNMSAGIDVAVRAIASSRTAGRAARVILISDGLANEGDASLEGLKARAARVTRWEHVLSTVGVGQDFNEFLMSALADAGTGNYYYLNDATELASVFSQEFEATRETVATGLVVTMNPGSDVRIVDAAGYPLERDGGQVAFRPGSLFSGQERRIWVTLQVPGDRIGSYDLGRVSLSYSDRGERHSLELEDVPVLACVADEDRFFASVDKDVWERSVLQETYNRLQEKVALAVKEGKKDQAVQAIEEYREQNATMNNQLASPAVSENLDEVSRLEEEVEEAFTGVDQELKQKRLSKERQAAGRDGRRVGSKKQ
jgi:Ca-activated chloride channel family protein